MSNYATKSDLKNATGIDKSKFVKEGDLTNLKLETHELYIDKLEKIRGSIKSLKSKVDELDADKLKLVLVDLHLFVAHCTKDEFAK